MTGTVILVVEVAAVVVLDASGKVGVVAAAAAIVDVVAVDGAAAAALPVLSTAAAPLGAVAEPQEAMTTAVSAAIAARVLSFCLPSLTTDVTLDAAGSLRSAGWP